MTARDYRALLRAVRRIERTNPWYAAWWREAIRGVRNTTPAPADEPAPF